MIVIAFCSLTVAKAQVKIDKNQAGLAAQDQLFLEKNKTTPGIITTASGLQYKVIKTGSGPRPPKFGRVQINYTLKTLDGKIVGSNGNTVFDHHMDKAYYGMQEALRLMPVGSKWLLFMPAQLCYSNYERSAAPGRAMTCTIELLSANQ